MTHGEQDGTLGETNSKMMVEVSKSVLDIEKGRWGLVHAPLIREVLPFRLKLPKATYGTPQLRS